jgi:hypothetical protein
MVGLIGAGTVGYGLDRLVLHCMCATPVGGVTGWILGSATGVQWATRSEQRPVPFRITIIGSTLGSVIGAPLALLGPAYFAAPALGGTVASYYWQSSAQRRPESRDPPAADATEPPPKGSYVPEHQNVQLDPEGAWWFLTSKDRCCEIVASPVGLFTAMP